MEDSPAAVIAAQLRGPDDCLWPHSTLRLYILNGYRKLRPLKRGTGGHFIDHHSICVWLKWASPSPSDYEAPQSHRGLEATRPTFILSPSASLLRQSLRCMSITAWANFRGRQSSATPTGECRNLSQVVFLPYRVDYALHPWKSLSRISLQSHKIIRHSLISM